MAKTADSRFYASFDTKKTQRFGATAENFSKGPTDMRKIQTQAANGE